MPSITVHRRRGRFAGLSPDDRRAARRHLLLDAAFDVLATEGASGTTVRAVCDRAGLNPRYFYEGFADLDELLVAVYDRLLGELRATLAVVLGAAPDDLRSQVHAAVAWTVGFVDDDRRRARVLYIESVGSERMNRRRVAAGYELTRFIEQDARRRHGADAPDPVGTLTAAVLVGGISEVLTSWIEGHIDVAREQLVEDLTELFVAVCDGATMVARQRRAGADVTTLDLIGLRPTDDPMWWRMPITKVMTTARGALYGGSGLAAVIAALEAATGRPLVWATAQYLSFVRMPATLDIRLATPVVGARTTQARGTVFHGDEEILSVLATLGHRDEHAHWTYAAPPDVPGPDETRRQVVAEAAGTIHDVLDMRIVRGVSRRQLLRGKPPVETGGRAAYWVRLPDGPHVPDAAELALVGDLVPSAFPSATGLPVSGSSLDNTIRTGELVATEWVLADVHVHAVVDGYGHGIAHLWSQDGTLLGTASQSAFVRRPDA